MINISQWRATIGLWYYQICDNVIDKSLPALRRKGTRAKRQSSEKHSQTNGNSTSVEQISSNEIPQSRYSNTETPISLSNGQKPVMSSDAPTPVILSNSSTANTTMRYADWCGRVQTISIAVFLFLLLILSGDIELNPGPKTGK